MAKFELKMPKLGESVQEATITKWMVGIGDTVEEDDNLLEIATDKVDSELPSPVDGKIIEIRFPVNSLVPVGVTIAVIETSEGDNDKSVSENTLNTLPQTVTPSAIMSSAGNSSINELNKTTGKFFSPLVKNIAKKENITVEKYNLSKLLVLTTSEHVTI